MRIIPCLDVLRGRVIKGRKFGGLVDFGDPVYMAQKYCDEGADELVVLNVSATRDCEENSRFCRLISSIAQRISVPLVVGGGIDSLQKVRALLNSGADKISLNSSAIAKPGLLQTIATTFGSQCITAAADVTRKEKQNDWEVRTYSGNLPSGISIVAWTKEVSRRGAGEILLTNINRDGTQAGFDVALVRMVTNLTDLPVVASGGGGTCLDCVEAMKLSQAAAILLASLLHSNMRSVDDVKRHFRNNQKAKMNL